MKRGTPDHPKTWTLAAVLDVPRWGAVGVLESLWHFAQEYAQAGDVGKFPDEAIARAIGWDGNAATLVSGLVKAGWVDRCVCHRARIHDWPEHSDQTVQRWLTSRSQWFLACYDDPSTMLAPDEPAVAVPLPEPRPKPKPSAQRRRAASPEIDCDANRAVVDAYNLAFGSRLDYTIGNLSASGRAYSAGYTLAQMSSVFRAVSQAGTPTAAWCKQHNRGLDYLIRPPYRHHRTGETVMGPLDRVLNELAAGVGVEARASPKAQAKDDADMAMINAGMRGGGNGDGRSVGTGDSAARGLLPERGGEPGEKGPPGSDLPGSTRKAG